MVVIDAVPTLLMGVMQERAAAPLRCTVQAPHIEMPQPNLVPVRLSVSRKNPEQRRVVVDVYDVLRSVHSDFVSHGLPRVMTASVTSNASASGSSICEAPYL